METSPGPWIEALRDGCDRLRATVEPLDIEQLEKPSYASDWSIARVLSHLGSQAEIFGLFLDAGLSGEDPPGADAFPPIWQLWDSRSAESQAADAVQADEHLVERFETLSPEERDQLHLALFGMELGTAGLAQLRLGEQAVHTWDVAVMLDQSARLHPAAVGLLVDTLDTMASRSGKPDGKKRRLHVTTTDPERRLTLETGEAVALSASLPEQASGELKLPAEALIRLVYGRLDRAHTPSVELEGTDLDELRRVFPGI